MKLKCDTLLSSFGFNFRLRRSSVAAKLNLGFKVVARSRADGGKSLDTLGSESATDDGLDLLRVVDMSVGPRAEHFLPRLSSNAC